MATGNHFWLDIAAGILVAGVAAAIVYRPWRHVSARTPWHERQDRVHRRARE